VPEAVGRDEPWCWARAGDAAINANAAVAVSRSLFIVAILKH
jgi:hypothetical protein